MGIAYYANHFVWFEVGRTEYCRAAGIPYAVMEEGGFALVVVEASCTYRRPAHYDHEIVVRTGLVELTRKTVTFAYRLEDADDRHLVAEGRTRHLVLDKAGRPSSLPADWLTALGRLSPDSPPE